MIRILPLLAILLVGCNPYVPPTPIDPLVPPITEGPSRVIFAAEFAGAPMGIGWTFSDDPNNTTTNTHIERAVNYMITATITLPQNCSVLEWEGRYISAGATSVTVDPAAGTRTVTAIIVQRGNG